MDTEAQAGGVERAADEKLRGCVDLPDARHDAVAQLAVHATVSCVHGRVMLLCC